MNAKSCLTLLVALCALGTMACNHLPITTLAWQVSPTLPPDVARVDSLSGDERILLTDLDLDFPCQPLAIVSTHSHRREDLETRGVAELRAEAERIGADAVIRVHAIPELTEVLAHRPGNLFRVGTQWVTVYRLSGIAVTFEGGESPEPRPLAMLGLNLPPEG
ncbi:hypothetical protein JXA47_09605 [Candidatus Sumerlaeota bacterium]|nr:hypothetical protein [Candidatus Sumerlaeota bacterium]